ncbi:MAG: winged helix-turn-helix domain-containing protein [Bacteroidales bacterium]
MNQECIGTNAGLIWAALNETNDQTFKGLKKATKLKEKELYMALGWLAREGKIKFIEEDEDIVIELVG